MAIVQVEVVDKDGRRCPLDNREVNFTMTGEGEWRGGIATRSDSLLQQADANRGNDLLDAAGTKNISDNYILSNTLPVECGVNRVLIRSTTTPGDIHVYASAKGLSPVASLTLKTLPVTKEQTPLPLNLSRGETPSAPSYTDRLLSVAVVSAETAPPTKTGSTAEIPGANLYGNADAKPVAAYSYDDNEVTSWRSDGTADNAWISYTLEKAAPITDIALKLTGWRTLCYPLAVYAYPKGSGKKGVKIWEGVTPASLGYVHLNIEKPVVSSRYTIRMVAPAQKAETMGDLTELAGGVANVLDRVKNQPGAVMLRIVEADFCAPR